MWHWWAARSKRKQEWNARVARVLDLEAMPEPDYGYGPHWEAILAGRREFAGAVLAGPYAGHDLLIHVYGNAALDRAHHPEDFLYSADYWITDRDRAGPGDDGPDPSFTTLEELQEWLTEVPVEWYPPYVALARVGLLSGYGGTQVP